MQDFKKELNFLEKAMIFPISNKMKEILKSHDKIEVDSLWDLDDLWFWRKILGAQIMNKKLFEKLTNKTFDFLKEKQEKIIEAETAGRLDELSALVINWKLDKLDINVWDMDNDSSNQEDGSTDTDATWEDSSETSNSKSENSTEEWEQGDSWAQEHSKSIVGAWWTVVAGTAVYYSSINRLNKAAWLKNTVEMSSESVDITRTKNTMQKAVDFLKEKRKSPKINKAMDDAYKKSIKVFEESIDWADGIWDDVFKAYKKLWSKIPDKYFHKFTASNKTLNAIDAMQEEELSKIVWKSSDEIKVFFDAKKLKCSDDLADMLRIAESASDLKWLSQVAKHGSKLSKMAKWLKWLSVIAVIWMWIDVFVYFETMKEAEAIAKINEIRWEVKRDQATAQLMVWVASLVAEAAIIIWACAAGGSMWWPIGTAVGLIVWAVTFATSVLLDELVYDKKAFYWQNRYDFIQQKRTTIKQSIVQLLESDRLDMNESMKENLQEDAEESGTELNTMEDAREALIYQEEVLEWWYNELQYYYFSWENQETYENNLKEEDEQRFENYTKQKEDMENVISIRMEYIKKYVNEDKSSAEYNKMADMVQKNKWIDFVQDVLADSKVYYHLKQENPDEYLSNYKDLDVAWYKSAYKEKLQSEYPDKFDILEKISADNPVHLQEIIVWYELSKSSIELGIEDWIYQSPEKENMEVNLDFLRRYSEYRQLWRPIEEKLWLWIRSDVNAIDYSYIEQILIDFDSIDKRPIWDQQQALDYFSNKDVFQSRLEAKYQASDSTWQNILYSMAREFHGYDWDNTSKDMMDFYNAANQDSTWIYYDDRWRINQDLDWMEKFQYLVTWDLIWMIFEWFDLNKIDTDNMSADEVYDKLIEWESFADYIWTSPWHSYLPESQWLDSAIEAADEKIIAEFKSKAKEIIDREIWYRDNKKVYEQKIIDFVKDQSKDREWYLEIPYEMVIEAKKAKIGNVENYLFKYENDKIIALSTWYHINESLDFDKTKIDIDYEALSPLRESLTPQEQAIVDKVSLSHERLEKLRSLNSAWANWMNSQKDELNIPIDIERQMSKKWTDWQDIEWSLLYLTPLSAQAILEDKWEEYYNYFEDTYIGIMATVSQFTWWDNMWNIDHMNKAFSWSNKQIIDINPSNNELFIPENVILEDDEKYFLLDYVKKIKDEDSGKTVEELLKSWDEEQVKHWEWMSKQILISILEAETIVFDDKWDPKSIWCNVDSKDESVVDGKMWYWQEPYMDPETWQSIWERYRVEIEPSTRSTKIMEERIKFHLGSGSTAFLVKWLTDIETSSIEVKSQKIRQVSESEEGTYQDINEMTENIINTMKKVDRAGRRWDPKFIADTESVTNDKVPWSFSSWDTKTKIVVYPWDTDYLTIEWLDMKFNDIEDWLRMANFINWVKWYYLPKNPDARWEFDFWSRTGKLYVDDSWINDTDILNSSTIEKYYPKLESKSWKKELLSYINSL